MADLQWAAKDVSWDVRWPDSKGWDEYTELISTLVDEQFPTLIPLDPGFPHDVVSKVVLAMIEDSDLRVLILTLLDITGDEVAHVNP